MAAERDWSSRSHGVGWKSPATALKVLRKWQQASPPITLGCATALPPLVGASPVLAMVGSYDRVLGGTPVTPSTAPGTASGGASRTTGGTIVLPAWRTQRSTPGTAGMATPEWARGGAPPGTDLP